REPQIHFCDSSKGQEECLKRAACLLKLCPSIQQKKKRYCEAVKTSQLLHTRPPPRSWQEFFSGIEQNSGTHTRRGDGQRANLSPLRGFEGLLAQLRPRAYAPWLQHFAASRLLPRRHALRDTSEAREQDAEFSRIRL